jgi:dUTP pyrophosphatase
MSTEIFIEKCRPDAKLPFYAHEGDAGMDLSSAEEVILTPGDVKLVPTGLKMAIPVGKEVQIRPRSGISLKTALRIPNAPGTIDSGYRGEVCVIMENTSPLATATNMIEVSEAKADQRGTYIIRKGDRIAQMVVASYEEATLTESSDVSAIGSDRQGGGFGSSGV